ncbi:hypothetical protein SCALM49S_04940 [Streptomyces californicus]
MGDRTQMVNRTKDVVGVTGVEGTALVLAARNGDRAAGERLAAQYLPLVYNVVGRALNGHPDVDDVVQETMLRALSGLPALRDPARFRSWLVAIAMNQVRSRWSHLGHRPAPLEETDEPADPAADFVDLTILRLELSGQRRETAEATRGLATTPNATCCRCGGWRRPATSPGPNWPRRSASPRSTPPYASNG